MQFDDIKNHIVMRWHNLENSFNSYKLITNYYAKIALKL